MTRSSAAGIACGAGVAVVAGRSVVGKDAPGGGVAGVIGTDVVVVADYRRSRMTRSSAAGIACRAGIAVAAGGSVVGKDPPGGEVAGARRSSVLVVADHG